MVYASYKFAYSYASWVNPYPFCNNFYFLKYHNLSPFKSY